MKYEYTQGLQIEPPCRWQASCQSAAQMP